MDFKLLVEQALNEHGDFYTLDELTKRGFSTWEASVKKMKKVQRFLKKAGYYDMGIRGLVIDIEPRNEIEQKAKEIFTKNPNLEYFEVQTNLHHWVNANLSKERVKEIEKECEQKGLREPIFMAVKILFFGLIVIPYKKSKTDEVYQQRQEFMDKLTVGIRNAGMYPHPYIGLHLRRDMEELGVTRFKVYKEYNIDRETEQAFGDILDEL